MTPTQSGYNRLPHPPSARWVSHGHGSRRLLPWSVSRGSARRGEPGHVRPTQGPVAPSREDFKTPRGSRLGTSGHRPQAGTGDPTERDHPSTRASTPRSDRRGPTQTPDPGPGVRRPRLPTSVHPSRPLKGPQCDPLHSLVPLVLSVRTTSRNHRQGTCSPSRPHPSPSRPQGADVPRPFPGPDTPLPVLAETRSRGPDGETGGRSGKDLPLPVGPPSGPPTPRYTSDRWTWSLESSTPVPVFQPGLGPRVHRRRPTCRRSVPVLEWQYLTHFGFGSDHLLDKN